MVVVGCGEGGKNMVIYLFILKKIPFTKKFV